MRWIVISESTVKILWDFTLVSYGGYNKYQKPESLKPHTYIILQFWRSEIKNESTRLRLRCQQGCVSSGGSRGKSIPLFSQRLEAALVPWLMALSLQPLLAYSYLLWLWSSLPPSCKDPCDYIRHIWIILKIISPLQDSFLDHICKIHFAL